MRRSLFVIAYLAATQAALADDMSLEFGRATETRTGFAQARAICEAAPAPAVPRMSSPVASCPDVDLFYGFDRPADPVAARVCALHYLSTKPPFPPGKAFYVYEPFRGALMLAALHANGMGVRRDLDKAIGFACRANILDLSATDIAAIIDALAARRGDPQTRESLFDVCAMTVHGTLRSSCNLLASRQRRESQHRRLDVLSKPFDAKTRQALRAALNAFEDFEAERAAHEIPPGRSRENTTTAPSETDRLLAQFTDRVETLITVGIHSANAADITREEAAMTHAFATATRLTHRKDVWQIEARKNLRADQAAWGRFRAAFVAAARDFQPKSSPSGLDLLLVKDRRAQVEQLTRDDLVVRPLSMRSRSAE